MAILLVLLLSCKCLKLCKFFAPKNLIMIGQSCILSFCARAQKGRPSKVFSISDDQSIRHIRTKVNEAHTLGTMWVEKIALRMAAFKRPKRTE